MKYYLTTGVAGLMGVVFAKNPVKKPDNSHVAAPDDWVCAGNPGAVCNRTGLFSAGKIGRVFL